MSKFELHVAYYVLLFAVYFVAFSLIPYSWYVDVETLEYGDICVGDDTIPVYSKREAVWSMRGDVWSQAVLFEGDLRLETTIYRKSDRQDGRVSFGYEPKTTEGNFQIKLDQPITKAGVYGLNEWVNIYPLPFIQVKTYLSADDTQFNVIDCNVTR